MEQIWEWRGAGLVGVMAVQLKVAEVEEEDLLMVEEDLLMVGEVLVLLVRAR